MEQMTEPYHRDVIWFREELLQMINQTTPELGTLNYKHPFLFRTAGTNLEFLCELFRNGVREAEAGQFGWNTLVTSNTCNILIHLARAGLDLQTKPMTAEKPELLDQVLSYVEVHMSEKITLRDTAHHFFISESTITQIFRKKMGISFYRYVTQRRLIASKALIEQAVALENVAEQVGFADYSSFYRAFKQEYGISPRQYRKMQTL
jgi:AraC-like DNA-binding protein